MMRSILCLLIGTAIIPAAEQQGVKDPSSKAEVQDIIFLDQTRPILIRTHIYLDGKPYSTAWREYVNDLHTFADRDNDGLLNEKELEYVPSVQQMQRVQSGYPNFYFNAREKVLLTECDTDSDEQVSKAELYRYYELRNIHGFVRFVQSNGQRFNIEALTEALFKRLDLDKDKKLSAKDLQSAYRLLSLMDADEDETLIATELVSSQSLYVRNVPRIGQGRAGMGMNMGGAMNGSNVPFELIPREKSVNRLTERLKFARRLLTRYDKDRSGRLTHSEIAIDKTLFKRLDGNNNNVLDSVEILRWIIAKPDLELTIRLGKLEKNQQAIELNSTSSKKGPLSVKQTSDDRVSLRNDHVKVELRRDVQPNVYRNTFQAYLRQFQILDTTKQGFVTLKQLEDGGARYRYYLQLAKNANVNNDSKVTFKELESFMALYQRGSNCVVSISWQQAGRGLFQMIDSNGDARLSGRELKSAATQLLAYDKDGDRKVSIKEFPYQYDLNIRQGGRPTYIRNATPVPNQLRVPTQGPIWFRKMDRNGDGDISKREFLGRPEHFRQLDTDKDDYISRTEAEAVEKTKGE